MDKTSLTLGWLSGRRIAAQRAKQKKPIAYLYNGVQLPDINTVWTDKETYPYAVIGKNIIDYTVILELSAVPFLAENDGTIKGEYAESYLIADGEWQSLTWPGAISWVWTNTDILNEDGSVYLSASDPIPVYA